MNYVSDSSVVSAEPSLYTDSVHASLYNGSNVSMYMKPETKENLVTEFRKQGLLVLDSNETRLWLKKKIKCKKTFWKIKYLLSV